MKTVYVVSLSKHRIDEMLADLIENALKAVNVTVKRELPNDNIRSDRALLIVTNGMMDYTNDWSINVVKAMDKYDSLYFCDDVTTYVPKAHVTIVSQFQDFSKVHPNIANKVEYWQISKLGDIMNTLPWMPALSQVTKEYDFVYWGHYKAERLHMYTKYIPDEKSTLIIGDYNEWVHILPNCTYKPYQRDMVELYKLIAKGRETAIFGDVIHNAAGNTPLRIYEAELCELVYTVDKALNADIGYCDCVSNIEIGKELLQLFKLTYGIEVQCKAQVVDTTTVCKKPNTQLEHTDTDTTSILAARATIYGTYISGVECRAKILTALNDKHTECNGVAMSDSLLVMFSDLALKMMRIASDPTHLDSYIDLEGYARIIKEAQIDANSR